MKKQTRNLVLALVADAVLLGLGRAATPWTRNRARA